MARRQFRDERGRQWDAWDVSPSDLPERATYDRRGDGRPSETLDGVHTARYLDSELEGGWLCFQAGIDRRRFAPIPVRWIELPDGVLRVMLDIASVVNSEARELPARANDESGDQLR